MRKLLLEGLAVALTGAVLAFATNALSPRGLKLTRNYFPESPQPQPSTPPLTNTPPGLAAIDTNSLARLAARLSARGLHLVDSNQVSQLFHDPRRALGLIVFIDARQPKPYEDGHIPGAYLFDHYYPENYLATILPLCQQADQVVVYCSGGDCDDSEFAAVMLHDDAQVPAAKLSVYGGGFTEWAAQRRPVELGARNSGLFRNAQTNQLPASPAPK